MFYSWSFIVLILSFDLKSISNLLLWLVWGGSRSFFFIRYLLKRSSGLHYTVVPLLYRYMCESVSRLSMLLHCSICLSFYQSPLCCNYCCFIMSLDIWDHKFSNFFFFQIILLNNNPLDFHVKFRQFVNVHRKTLWILFAYRSIWGELSSLQYTRFMDFESFNSWTWYIPSFI